MLENLSLAKQRTWISQDDLESSDSEQRPYGKCGVQGGHLSICLGSEHRAELSWIRGHERGRMWRRKSSRHFGGVGNHPYIFFFLRLLLYFFLFLILLCFFFYCRRQTSVVDSWLDWTVPDWAGAWTSWKVCGLRRWVSSWWLCDQSSQGRGDFSCSLSLTFPTCFSERWLPPSEPHPSTRRMTWHHLSLGSVFVNHIQWPVHRRGWRRGGFHLVPFIVGLSNTMIAFLNGK